MSKPRIKLIMNPNADMGNAWKYAADLRHLFEGFADAEWAGTVYPTHAKLLAKQAAEEGFDIVVAMGGDGTAHEVANGLMEVPEDKRPIFGVIPLGSGNDFSANVSSILTSSTRPANRYRMEKSCWSHRRSACRMIS